MKKLVVISVSLGLLNGCVAIGNRTAVLGLDLDLTSLPSSQVPQEVRAKTINQSCQDLAGIDFNKYALIHRKEAKKVINKKAFIDAGSIEFETTDYMFPIVASFGDPVKSHFCVAISFDEQPVTYFVNPGGGFTLAFDRNKGQLLDNFTASLYPYAGEMKNNDFRSHDYNLSIKVVNPEMIKGTLSNLGFAF